MTISTARLIYCYCSRTSLYTTAARSTARTPRRPAAYCTIMILLLWTYISASSSAISATTSTTSTAGVWRGKNNYNRSKRQQPRRTMYHYSWSVLKRFWLLGYVNWPFKSKLHCLPRQHRFFFWQLTLNLGVTLILHLTLTWQTWSFWGAEHLANNADLLTSLPNRHAQWNQKPGIIYEGQKNLSFHFFKKERWLNKDQPYANRPPHCHSLKRVKHWWKQTNNLPSNWHYWHVFSVFFGSLRQSKN